MTHSCRAVIVLFVLSLFVSSSAITAFAQTGDVDPNGTVPQVCITVPANLRYRDVDSSTGGAVSLLQNFLIGEGYMQGEATGRFGAMTFASVQRYQTAKGLSPVSGYVGPMTRAAIHSDSCSSDAVTTGTVSQNTITNTIMNQAAAVNTVQNTMQNTVSSNAASTPAPARPATGILSSSGGSKGCTVVLGASTCPITVRWSSLNYASSPYLSVCQMNNGGTCGASETKYIGANGSHLFNLGVGTSWLFSLWGIDYLGQLVKTDQLSLKGRCAEGAILSTDGTSCVPSSTTSNNSNQFMIGPGNASTQSSQDVTSRSAAQTPDVCAGYDASQFCTTQSCTTNTGIVRHGTKVCSDQASTIPVSVPTPAPVQTAAVAPAPASAAAPDVCAGYDASQFCTTQSCTTNTGVVRYGTKNCAPAGGSGWYGVDSPYNVSNSAAGDSSGSGPGGAGAGAGAGGSGGGIGGNNGDDGGAVGSGVSI